MRDGQVAGTTWQVADVKRPLMSVAKMVVAGNRVHLDSKDPRIVRPKGGVLYLRKAGNVFVVDLWVRKMQPAGARFSLAGMGSDAAEFVNKVKDQVRNRQKRMSSIAEPCTEH